MERALHEKGFTTASWIDTTAAGVAWFADRASERQKGVSALGMHVVMGPGFAEMASNLARNLREGRAGLIQAVLEKP